MAEMGRPLKPIDWKLVDNLLGIQCTKNEICSALGVSSDTLSRRCQDENEMTFADYSAQKGDVGRMSIRRKQFEIGNSGNVTMLIWLGKQYLGQSDKNAVEYTGTLRDLPDSELDRKIEEKMKRLAGGESDDA